MTKKQRRKPARAASAPATTDVTFTLEELELLARVLQSSPITGTADSLTTVLPLFMGVRLKIAEAARLLVAPPAEPEPEEEKED